MKTTKKVPVQIYLEPEQDRLLRRVSQDSGMSKAAIIRSCISRYLEDLPVADDPAWRIVNLGASGKGDVAARHDEYLAGEGQSDGKP
jgi:predicted DNA-binding protein